MAHSRISKLPLCCMVFGVALAAGGCFAPRNRPWLAPNEPAVLHQPGGGLLPSSDPALDDPSGARAGSALASRLAAAQPAPSPQAMHDVMVELQGIGAVDPAAQAQLLQDLERTNPSLWPEVIQSFRARRAGVTAGASSPFQTDVTSAAALPLTSRLTNSTTPTAPWSALAVPPITKDDQVVLKEWPKPSPNSPSDATMLAASGAAAASAAPPSATAEAGAPQPPTVMLPEGGASEPGRLVLDNTQPAPPPQAQPPAAPDQGVRQVSFTAPGVPVGTATPAGSAAPVAQDVALAAAITALEATLQEPVKSAADAPRHAYLRLLYLAAGRREDALRPIAGLSPTEQEYWDKQLRAMATWLDVERIPDAPSRAAEASQRLSEATARLAQLSSLAVRNMAFCTEVSSYGVYTRFKESNFSPGQQVLLYAEVENFKSVETHRGFHTALRTSYQIVDMAGNPVVKDEPQSMEEYCQNPRRDYFVRYRLHLPKGIASGRYRLQLTIEDTLGEKSGVSNIEFTVTTP